MSLATVASYVGFASMVVGVYLVAGPGYACLVGGAFLFVAGNLTERR